MAISGIKGFKVIQEKKTKFKVLIVRDADFSKKTIRGVEEHIASVCSGEKVKVEVKIVNKIPRDKSGKLRKVISKVKK